MIPYQTKTKRFTRNEYREVRKQAIILLNKIKKQTKRRPYVRSTYFNKQKIFFDFFWKHLFQKNPKERIRRLQYLAPALEIIKNSKNHPLSEENPHKKSEILHRFAGLTKDKELFYVQIKENKRTNKKYLMSVFPE